MKTILLLFILSSFTTAQTMDSLMRKALIAEMKAGRVSGYVFSHGQQPIKLTSPDRLFNRQPIPVSTPSNNFSVSYETLQKEINDLKVEQAKTSYVIESLIKQSESHSKNTDFILKLVEIIMGAIATVIAAYSVAKIKGKKS